MTIKIIDTGVANIRSLQAAFDRIGAAWELTDSPVDVTSARYLILPGVGAFAAAVRMIDRMKLREPLIKRIESDRPLLCVCLGMQLLAESSEEAEGAEGLGIVSARIQRFPDSVTVPQLGWNEVRPVTSASFSSGEAYFANSYRLSMPSDQTNQPDNGWLDGWGYAVSDYGGPFISSIWRGTLLACQFHPELSGLWGQNLLATWWKGEVTGC